MFPEGTGMNPVKTNLREFSLQSFSFSGFAVRKNLQVACKLCFKNQETSQENSKWSVKALQTQNSTEAELPPRMKCD